MPALNRRQFLQGAGAAAVAVALPGSVHCAAGPARAGGINVLFLMTDEHHHRALSIAGDTLIATPNLDRIGREGVRFENATCVTPYCSPSRATMITGLYPHTHGIQMNVGGKGTNASQAALAQNAFPNTETILHRRGWATGFRGKWHLGDLGDFDCYESFEYGGRTAREYREFLDAHLPAPAAPAPAPAAPRKAGKAKAGKKAGARAGGIGTYLGREVKMIPAMTKAAQEFAAGGAGVSYIGTIGRSVIPPELLPETRITDEVLKLIEKNAQQNFMITASWSPPHDLWVTPDPYYSMVDRSKVELAGSRDLPRWDQRGASKQLGDLAGEEGRREYAAIYHGMVKYIDDQVGRILKKVDELGLTDNTLVIFTSDHGDMVGAHGCIGKSITGIYDDLLRIPLMMRLPGRIKPGTVVRQPVSQVDYCPTILDYAGAPAPAKAHGKSLRPLIEGREVPWRDYAFCQRAGAIRMLRTAEYKYTVSPDRRIESLYDLQADPHEDRNLAGAAEQGATLKMMRRRLLEVMAADGDPLHDKLAAALK